ncbi:hypothetical protein AB237_1910 [Acinetobacter baumannii NCGM 237]|nr:hypothetical protein AB237_1910 [Acinetobacter baumannii NCGM 237]
MEVLTSPLPAGFFASLWCFLNMFKNLLLAIVIHNTTNQTTASHIQHSVINVLAVIFLSIPIKNGAFKALWIKVDVRAFVCIFHMN